MEYRWIIVWAALISSCESNRSNGDVPTPQIIESKAVPIEKLRVFQNGGDVDIVISNWYADQSRAYDTLNQIEGAMLKSGTKITVSPATMLDKQLEYLKTLRPELFDSMPMRVWFEDQELTTEWLYSELGIEPKNCDKGATTLENAEEIIELQKWALEELLEVSASFDRP